MVFSSKERTKTCVHPSRHGYRHVLKNRQFKYIKNFKYKNKKTGQIAIEYSLLFCFN